MESLQDFNTAPQNTLQDFQPDPHSVAAVYSRASMSALAAKSAAIGSQPDQAISNVQQMNAESTLSGNSQLQEQLVKQAKQNHFEANRSALLGILGDQAVPESVKQDAIQKVYDQGSDLYSIDHMVSNSSLNAPVQNETGEEETVRVDTAGAINELNGVRMQQQAMVNHELANINPDTKSKVVDFLKGFVPFGERSSIAAQRAAVTGDDSTWNSIKSWALQGSAKQDIADAIENASPQERLEMVQKAIDVINTHNGITASDDNQINQMKYLQEYLTEGGYGGTQALVDNLTGVADFAMLGGAIKGTAKGALDARAASKAAEAADLNGGAGKGWEARWQAQQSNAARDNVRSQSQPSTLSQIYKDTNADKYRASYDAVANSTDPAVAEATHGTTRQDALVGDTTAEIGHVDGSVKAKPGSPDGRDVVRNAPDPALVEFMNFDSGNRYFQSEKANARANVVNDFQQAYGMTTRGEMFQAMSVQHDLKGGQLQISAMYGPQTSGYSNAQDALDTAKYALRAYGLDESQISLVARAGSEYLPATQEQIARGDGDFLVKVDYTHRLNNGDVTEWFDPNVNLNFGDRVAGSGKRGTLTSNLLDAASVQDPVVFKAFSTAVDREAGAEKMFLGLANDYAKRHAMLGHDAGDFLTKVIMDGNDRGVNFTAAELRGMGMDDDQIGAYMSHRVYNDNMYHFENVAYGRHLTSQGFEHYVNGNGGHKLVARPIGKGSLTSADKVYDPLSDGLVKHRDLDLDSLYKTNGTLAELRQPLHLGSGEYATHIKVSNNPDSYLRKINDKDEVLAYRPGYYRVAYKDPHFIDKKVRNAQGEVIGHQTIATAPSRQEADLLVRRFNHTAGIKEDLPNGTISDAKSNYRRRYGREIGINASQDAHYDMQVSQGRSTQMFRGKRLEDITTNTPQGLASQNIKNHVEVMVEQARSLAKYMTVSDAIETAKARVLDRAKDYLPSVNGRPVWPSDASPVAYHGSGTADMGKLADTKTQVAYINYMQHGYVNSINSGSKAMLWNLADAVGAKSPRAEKAIAKYAAGGGPTRSIGAITFNALIAMNPLRQILVQAHQAIMLSTLNPAWALGPKGANQLSYMIFRQLGMPIDRMPEHLRRYFTFTTGMSEKEFIQLGKDYDLSGQGASIDKHSMVSGSLQDMADKLVASSNRTAAVKYATAIPRAIGTAARKIGFDAGEYINTTSSWLAHRDLAIRNGLDMSDPAVAAEVAARARNFTGNMNRAGNQPYNETELNILLKYMQNPHKLALNMVTNRVMTPWEKARFAAGYFALFGFGSGIVYSGFFDKALPSDPKDKKLIATGLEQALVNKALSMMAGRRVELDLSSLSPVDMYGIYDHIHGLLTSDVGAMVASAPDGSLYGGSNPRMTNLAKTTARYTNLIDDYDNPTTFKEFAHAACNVFSGCSNAWKAGYLLAYQRKLSANGRTVDASGMGTPEAMAQLLGIQDYDTATLQKMQKDGMDNKKQREQDIKTWYTSLRMHLADQDITPDQMQYAVQVHSEFFRAFQHDDNSYRMMDQLLKQDLQQGNDTVYNSIIKQVGITPISQLKDKANTLGSMTDEQKQTLNKVLDQIKDWQDNDPGMKDRK